MNNINFIDFKFEDNLLSRAIEGLTEEIPIKIYNYNKQAEKFDISVIITNFNREFSISDAIQSVLKNSEGVNIELIIVDDASSDKSLKVIKRFLKQSNIRLIRLLKNSGNESLPKNIGGYFSNGKYLSFLDSDDQIIHKKGYKESFIALESDKSYVMTHSNIIFEIKCPISNLDNLEWVLTLDDYKNIKNKNSSISYKIRKSKPYSKYELMTYGYYDGLKLIRKDIWKKVGGTVEWLESCCDFGLIIKLLKYGKVKDININAYKYIIHGSNDSFYSEEKRNRYYENHRKFVLNELLFSKIDFKKMTGEANEEFKEKYKFTPEELGEINGNI